MGVPEIAQLLGFRMIPAGSAGLTLQSVIPPVKVGTRELYVPVVNVADEPAGKLRLDGGSAVPFKVKEAVAVPY